MLVPLEESRKEFPSLFSKPTNAIISDSSSVKELEDGIAMFLFGKLLPTLLLNNFQTASQNAGLKLR